MSAAKRNRERPKANRLVKNKYLWFGIMLGLGVAAWIAYGYYRQHAIEQLLRERISASRELVDLLQSIEDEEGMKSAWPKLVEHYKRETQLAQRFRGIAAPSEQELAEKWGKYQSELQHLLDLKLRAIRRIKGLEPSGEAFYKKLSTLKSHDPSMVSYQGVVP